MEKLNRAIGIAASLIVIIIAALALSYCSELPKRSFAAEAMEIADRPGVKLLSSSGAIDPVSPTTWFDTPKTTFVFARPEPPNADIFTVIVFRYKEAPSAYMVQMDCEAKEVTRAFTAEKGYPLRNLWGEEFREQRGKTFNYKEAVAAPTADMKDFCASDWSTERRELIPAGRD